ncbi:MAG: carbamate kinase [Chloroflexota bacterium]
MSLVVAFGGNAISPAGRRGTLEEQRANVRGMSAQLAQLVLGGQRVIVTHGNGPQVGEIMLKSEIARDRVPPLTLDMAGAMSQGQIGYLLQQEIGRFLVARRSTAQVVSLVTQVVVDAGDPAFRHPTKPIGRFYSSEEAEALRQDEGWEMVEDAGRGYRRVVPSPRPLEIVEWPVVKALTDEGALVIAAGGGGIPVIRGEDGLEGVEAVIDKDFASERLGTLVGADTLVLLTGVDRVAVNFGTADQRELGTVGLEELKRHFRDGQFPAGSMGPKIEASIQFLESAGEGEAKRVVITSPESMVEAVSGNAGTQIVAGAPAAASMPA